MAIKRCARRCHCHMGIIDKNLPDTWTLNSEARSSRPSTSPPDPPKQSVDGQIAEGRYCTVSESIRELIREDEKRKAQKRLEMMLLEGLDSRASELTRKDSEEIREETLAQLKRRKGQLPSGSRK